MRHLPPLRLPFAIMRIAAVSLFGLYLFWNVLWWIHGQLAPSMLLAFTGLPAPTTGVTRSLQHLWAGDVWTSLHYNPMSVPILLLIATTIAIIARRGLHKQRLVLPPAVALAWACVLGIGWIAKFILGPAYW